MKCKKVKFATQSGANFYINKLKETSDRIKRPTRAYLCPFCLLWHLTSMTSQEEDLLAKYREKIKQKNELITQLNNRIAELKNKISELRGGPENPNFRPKSLCSIPDFSTRCFILIPTCIDIVNNLLLIFSGLTIC